MTNSAMHHYLQSSELFAELVTVWTVGVRGCPTKSASGMDEKDLFEEGKKKTLFNEAATNRTKEDALYSAERFPNVPQGSVCVCVCMCVCVYIYIYFFFPPQSNSKLKLVRSLAVCEESSAPFVDGPLETQVGPL